MSARSLEIRGNLKSAYPDVFTPEAVAALAARIERRAARARNKQRIAFLDPQATIARTKSKSRMRATAISGVRFRKTSSGSGLKAPVLPWYVDLLNINLDNHDLTEAKRRIRLLADAFRKDGTRITQNLDFDAQRAKAQ